MNLIFNICITLKIKLFCISFCNFHLSGIFPFHLASWIGWYDLVLNMFLSSFIVGPVVRSPPSFLIELVYFLSLCFLDQFSKGFINFIYIFKEWAVAMLTFLICLFPIWLILALIFTVSFFALILCLNFCFLACWGRSINQWFTIFLLFSYSHLKL